MNLLPLFALECLLLFASPVLGAYHGQPLGLVNSAQAIFDSGKDTLNAVRDTLKKSAVIPDVLNDFKPVCFLAPYYTKKHRSVTLGNELKPSKVQSPPAFKIYCPSGLDVKGLTIVLTDPDAPSRQNPEWSQVCHWVGRIPIIQNDETGSVGDMSLASGAVQDLVEYKPPGPPPRTGLHRYVFVLLEGKNANLTVPTERKHWGTGSKGYGVQDWAEKEGLKVIGANFFVSKNKKQKS